MRVYLDQDGCISAFCKSAFKLHNSGFCHNNWPEGKRDILEALDIPIGKFWKEIDKAGHKFWHNLELFPWTKDLLNLARQYDRDFHLLTSPSSSPECVKGKMMWIQQHLGGGFRNYIFAPAKSKKYCAGPDRVLIDDKPSNIVDWNRQGGYGILFPQPWNTPTSKIPTDRVEYVEERLNNFQKELERA